MADVFISYSKHDRSLANALAETLLARGYKIWWDSGIVGGEDWRDVILAELDAAKAVIVIWTASSSATKFVLDEAEHAAKDGKLIPVRLANFEIGKIPLGLRNLQTLLLSDRVGIMAALARLGVFSDLPLVSPDSSSRNAPAQECDRVAADPLDDQNPIEYSQEAQIQDGQRGIALCEMAIAAYPEISRFHNALGHMLGEGEEARAAFERAAVLGNGAALYHLYQMHIAGQFTYAQFPDAKKSALYRFRALNYFLPKAKAGNFQAMLLVSKLSDDDFEAIGWLEKCAERGDVDSMISAASKYITGSSSRIYAFPADDKKALQYLENAINSGSVEALKLAANMLSRKNNTLYNPLKAVEYYEKAAELGYSRGWKYSADICAADLVDIERAETNYLKAIDVDDEGAITKLAKLYERHRVSQDIGEKVKSLYETAINNGDIGALGNLAKLYLKGNLLEKNIYKAEVLLKRAADLGEISAMVKLAECYRDGDFGKKSVYEAAGWLKKAAETGSAYGSIWYDLATMLDQHGGFEREKVGEYILNSLLNREYETAEMRALRSLNLFNSWSDVTRMSLQKKLRDDGFYGGLIDGEWGEQSQNAFEAFLAMNRL